MVMQECGEPAQGALVDADRAERLAGAEPVAAGSFDRLAQPRLWDVVEADGWDLLRRRPCPERGCPPRVPRELGLGVDALGQVEHMLPGETQLAHRPATGVGQAMLVGQQGPALQAVVQQRADLGCDDQPDEAVDHHRDEADRSLIVADLNGVGHLQPQL